VCVRAFDEQVGFISASLLTVLRKAMEREGGREGRRRESSGGEAGRQFTNSRDKS
jgi:hypothetical protein